MAQLIALAYVLVAVPYRIGFEKEVGLLSFWFFVDLTIDLYFIIDIYVSFRTAFYTKQGELEYRKQAISRNYIRSWLPLDFVSCLPVNYVTYLPGVNTSGSGYKANKGFRMLRLLRLLKLLRLARFNRIIARYEQEFHSLMNQLKIGKLIFIIVAIGHLLCCGWYWVGTLEHTFHGAGIPGADGEFQARVGWVEKQFGDVRGAPLTECEFCHHKLASMTDQNTQFYDLYKAATGAQMVWRYIGQ